MTDGHDDLDLLAYAEGRLTGDQAARVEARLREDPELARRVRDFAEQDRELHARFDRYAEEPLPPRLAALFEAPERPAQAERRPARLVARAAAVSALMAATGAGGWWLGQGGWITRGGERPFVQAAVERYSAPVTDRAASAGRAVAPALSGKLAGGLRPPDLSARGYRLRGRKTVVLDGAEGLMLHYRNAAGESVRVFVKRRDDGGAAPVHTRRDEDVTVAYWNDGPLRIALATRQADTAAVKALARRVRRSLEARAGGTPDDGLWPRSAPAPAPRATTRQASTSPAVSADQTGPPAPDAQP
mgnify:CR=1 FL=1